MTKPFTVVVPTMVTDANLVSHSVPETEFPLYDPLFNYALGARVVYGHAIYLSLEHPNTGNTPDMFPLSWRYISPTNRYAMFDESGGTFTTATDSIEFVVTGDRLDSFGFLDVKAVSIRIRASSAMMPNYYDQTINLSDDALINSWHSYFNASIERKTTAVVFGVTSISNSTYTITITGAGPIQIGTFVMGRAKEFGFAEYGATIGIKSYGRIEEDNFGRRTRVRRGFAKRMNVNLLIDKNVTDSIQRQFENLRETAALWVAADGIYESTTIYGDYRDFSIVLAYPTQNQCSLDIEGIA